MLLATNYITVDQDSPHQAEGYIMYGQTILGVCCSAHYDKHAVGKHMVYIAVPQ